MKKIDLVTFLYNYYGICNPSLRKRMLEHSDIKVLFPYIKAYSYCSPSDLERGNYIGVYDKNNRVQYYYNPRLEKVVHVEYEVSDEEEKKEISLNDINNLSKEELLKLRRKLRLNNQRKESYLINKLIKRLKQEEPRQYREKKQKILLKESMYD